LRIPYLILFYTSLVTVVHAQNERFYGGFGDGYTLEVIDDSTLSISLGQFGDGYASGELAGDANTLSKGAFGDGYAIEELEDSTLSISLGQFGDGYASGELAGSANTLSKGAFGDGYAIEELKDSTLSISLGQFGDGYASGELAGGANTLSKGGNGDGYDYEEFIKVYWTGNIGTAWLNGSNWSTLTVPDNDDEIIIPPGRPNYPLLGAQLLSIGDPDITTGFRCAELWVQDGASFSGKLNTTLANQSLLLIDGTFIWQNPSASSFLNHLGGVVRVREGGVLMTNL
jgi:hypothetical protein